MMDITMMKPQASIAKHQTEEQSYFTVSIEQKNKNEDISTHFRSFQDALDFILANDWQLKREPVDSSYVEMRFLKP